MLAVSLGLRWWLASAGGQDYWPDESRYYVAQDAAAALVHGRWGEAGALLLGRPDHPLFFWAALPPAFCELVLGPSPALVAAYLGLFSTLAIYLVWRVARRAGAGDREALLAAFLAAGANSLFYFSRHYFPYDIALCLMLLALEAAVGPWSARRSLAAGALAGLGFLTYEGYWLLGGCVLVLHGLLGDGGIRRAAGRILLGAAGLAMPLGLFLLLSRLAGYNLITGSVINAATITQGDFHVGYRVIAAYLWHTEGVLFLLWLAGAAGALMGWSRERGPARAAWWLAGLVVVAGGLVCFSDIVPKFVVYGRLVRQMVPFFCLAAAFTAERLAGRGILSRRMLAWGVAAVTAVAAWNFATPLRQIFPDGFRRLATAAVYRQQRAGTYCVYRVVNDEHLWGNNLRPVFPPSTVVLERAHPLQFRPYQYEGFTAAQRADLNRPAVAMRLLRLTGDHGGPGPELLPAPAEWGGYPGPVRMRLRFAPGEPGRGQPLVTAGTARHADFLYVLPVGPDRVRFGYDHWDAKGLISDPVEVDFTRTHDLVVSLGALLPPAGGGDGREPGEAYLRTLLLVVLDGRIVWSQQCAAYTVAPETITFGANFVGGSTAAPSFAGRISELERAPLGTVLPHVGALAGRTVGAERPPAWGGAPGPLALRCTLPEVRPGVAEPLLAVGAPGEGDLLFWIRERDDRIRFAFERRGEGVVFSEAEVVPAGGVHQLVLSLGSMMPGAASGLYQADPILRRLRDLLLVSLDGRVVFLLKRAFAGPTDNVVVGANSVGSSVAGAFFTGNLLAIEPADAAAVLATSVQLSSRIRGRAPLWEGYPGPVRVQLYFPVERPRLPEPLIVTGETGKGDFIYVRYEGEDRIRVGFDHWGVGGAESPAIPVDPAREHELAVSFGGLMPPAGSPLYRAEAGWQRLRAVLWVAIDGRTVFVTPMATHPTRPSQIMFGVNFIGGSTTGPSFTGRIMRVDEVDPRAVLAQTEGESSPAPAPPR